jgi:pimeloyl-ACP methyl ester carboxylesterase
MKNYPLVLLCFFSIAVFGQSTPGKFIADKHTGCQVWVNGGFSPADSLTISWSGACKAKKAEGSGTLVWYVKGNEVSRYEGAMKSGNPNGQGKYTFPGGVVQEGSWVQGVLQGHGKITFGNSGRKLEGNFTDGELLDLDSSYRLGLHKNIVSHNDSTDIYINDKNAKDLLYYALIPPGKINGVIVLLPGTWDRVEYVLSSNKVLCQLAYDRNIAVIVPSVNQRLTLNKEVLDFLNTVFLQAAEKYGLPKDKFVLGGFSMGGLFSIRYTELAYQDHSLTAIRPAAVYSVDGPMDLAHMYDTEQRAIEKNPQAQEPQYIIDEFKKHIGGTPADARRQYVYYSAYSREEKDGGNIRYLANVPLRIYNDVDVNWWLENRNADLYDMNALDQSAAIATLQRLGNKQAAFINAYGKGYRLDGARHPHSWSIVNAADCISWVWQHIK